MLFFKLVPLINIFFHYQGYQSCEQGFDKDAKKYGEEKIHKKRCHYANR